MHAPMVARRALSRDFGQAMETDPLREWASRARR